MPSLTDLQSQAIEAAICAGRRIEAISLYLEALPDCGFAEAKRSVVKLEAGLRGQNPDKFVSAHREAGYLGVLVTVAMAAVVSIWIASVSSR